MVTHTHARARAHKTGPATHQLHRGMRSARCCGSARSVVSPPAVRARADARPLRAPCMQDAFKMQRLGRAHVFPHKARAHSHISFTEARGARYRGSVRSLVTPTVRARVDARPLRAPYMRDALSTKCNVWGEPTRVLPHKARAHSHLSFTEARGARCRSSVRSLVSPPRSAGRCTASSSPMHAGCF